MDFEQSTIKGCAEERGIERLCHFTRLESLSRIIESGALMSRDKLGKEGRSFDFNDKLRFDKRLDHICLSVAVPNPYLMAKFVSRFPNVNWIVLELGISLLWSEGTEFCPTNAAASSGNLCDLGANAFKKLFDDEVQIKPWELRTRRPDQRRDHPTDIQAEVLVKSFISLEHVAGICVKSDGDYEEVQSILEAARPPLEIPIRKSSSFFSTATVWR